LPAPLLLEVEGDPLLAAVVVQVQQGLAVDQGRAPSVSLPVGRLDLDHLGAELGEEPAAVRASQMDGVLYHAYPLEGCLHHLAFRLSTNSLTLAFESSVS